MRLRSGGLCLAASLLAASFAAPAAHALVYTDINDFNMCETPIEANSGGYNTSSDNANGRVEYRWLDSPVKTTVISVNGYFTYDLYDKVAISAGDTTYHLVAYRGMPSSSFRLMGRTQIGSGCMYYFDGRVNR